MNGGIPTELKEFKKEAKEYYLPANQMKFAKEDKWDLKFNVCTIEYPNATYYALGKCKDLLK